MVIVKNLRLDKGSNEDKPFYKWDVVDNGKSATFYTDHNGQNIWQEGVKPEKTQIFASKLDPLQKDLVINVKASEEEIKKQLQQIAESGFFTKYLK